MQSSCETAKSFFLNDIESSFNFINLWDEDKIQPNGLLKIACHRRKRTTGKENVDNAVAKCPRVEASLKRDRLLRETK